MWMNNFVKQLPDDILRSVFFVRVEFCALLNFYVVFG